MQPAKHSLQQKFTAPKHTSACVDLHWTYTCRINNSVGVIQADRIPQMSARQPSTRFGKRKRQALQLQEEHTTIVTIKATKRDCEVKGRTCQTGGGGARTLLRVSVRMVVMVTE